MLPSQYLNIGQEDRAEKVKYLVTENCIFFIEKTNLKLWTGQKDPIQVKKPPEKVSTNSESLCACLRAVNSIWMFSTSDPAVLL